MRSARRGHSRWRSACATQFIMGHDKDVCARRACVADPQRLHLNFRVLRKPPVCGSLLASEWVHLCAQYNGFVHLSMRYRRIGSAIITLCSLWGAL